MDPAVLPVDRVNGDGREEHVSAEQPVARVDLEVPDAVLAERRRVPKTFGAQGQRGWLGVYQHVVTPVHEGAVLK